MPEVLARFGLPKATLEALQAVLARHAEVTRAVVYGSRAMGTHRPGSDIDLTLHGSALKASDLLAIEVEIDGLDLPYRVDLSIYSQIDDPALRAHIDRVGQPIHPAHAGAR